MGAAFYLWPEAISLQKMVPLAPLDKRNKDDTGIPSIDQKTNHHISPSLNTIQQTTSTSKPEEYSGFGDHYRFMNFIVAGPKYPVPAVSPNGVRTSLR